MPESSRLTVVIPTCNGARHLREALLGIQSQENFDFDLVVSDDRSDDDTLAIVRELMGDQVRVSVNSERLGLAGNWNRSVALSQTEWVTIFHQDDVMRPGHLASHGPLMNSDLQARIGMIAGPVEMIDDRGKPVSALLVDPGGIRAEATHDGTAAVLFAGAWVRFLSVENPFRCSAVTIRKEAHEAIGGFDPAYRYAVDWDFWHRIGREWGLAWRIGPPSVAMRWHLASETHRFRTGTTDLDEQVRLLERIHETERTSSTERRFAHRRLARAFLNRAHSALKGGDINLARTCLDRSVQLSRDVLLVIASDPRLAIQMAAVKWTPGQVARWFGSGKSGGELASDVSIPKTDHCSAE